MFFLLCIKIGKMADKCAYPKCGKELVHTAGRKNKKYCNQNCNTRHWQMKNPKYKKKSIRVPMDKLSEDKVYSWKGGNLIEVIMENNKPENKERIMAERNGTPKEIKRNNPLTIDECESPNQELISKYEEELSKLGTGEIAKQRRKFLEKKIKELKQ